jgi:uncharacterized membrane protein (DUF106 family)
MSWLSIALISLLSFLFLRITVRSEFRLMTFAQYLLFSTISLFFPITAIVIYGALVALYYIILSKTVERELIEVIEEELTLEEARRELDTGAFKFYDMEETS